MTMELELAESIVSSRPGNRDNVRTSFGVDRGAPLGATSIAGIADIAERRRRLLSLVRDLHDAVNGPRPRREALRLLGQIAGSAEVLYRIEDVRMSERHDPIALEHGDAHRSILADLREAILDASRADARASLSELVHATDALLIHEFAELRPGDGFDALF
jgi:hypothetical protein